MSAFKFGGITLAALGTAAVVAFTSFAASASDEPFIIPAPKSELKADAATGSKSIVLAGGCFWGVQGVFQHTKGVINAVSGYAGGAKDTAAYEEVSTGTTGHAESVKITYDPKEISLGKLLQIYFSVVQDPTQLNYQGPDHGTQYRSAIFTSSPDEKAFAAEYIAQLNATHVYKKPIVTKIEPMSGFYAAEKYHQNYLTLHPQQPYIAFNDIPKVENLKKVFPDDYRAQPVLVSATGVTN